MTWVTDNFAANLNPTPKSFKMYKTLSVTAVSGTPRTDTQAIFTKNCPFPVKVVAFEVQVVSLVASGFAGSGSNLRVRLQSSTDVDTSPAAPTTVSWQEAVEIDCSGISSNTDKSLFKAPSNDDDLVDVSLDQSWVAVPKGGSLRTTLSAQANNAVGWEFSTPVELLAIVTCVPTEKRDQRYF